MKARGFNIQPNDPLTLAATSCARSRPDFCDVRSGEIASSDQSVLVAYR